MTTRDNRIQRRGGVAGRLIGIIALVAIAGAVLWVMRPSDSATTTARTEGDRFEVRRGTFDITIPTSGELAARDQIEIKNLLETRAVITWVVDEGKRVKKGDLLVSFNDEDLKNKIKDQEEKVDIAQNNLEKSESDFAISLKTRDSEMAAADLRIRLAKLALSSWEEGEDVTSRQNNDLRVQTAEKEHERAVARFEAAGRLMEREFISVDDYKRDEITLLEAESALKTAKLEQRVYLEYDSIREREEKESDLQQAKDERERTRERLEAEIASVQSSLRTRTSQLERAEEQLEKWLSQVVLCTVKAPSDGLVVYASSLQTGRWGRNEQNPPQVGTEVPRSKTIMILPDVSQMIASVKVNESLSGLIKSGQPATVFADALPDVSIEGEVLGVSVLAETGGWRDPNRRDYTVRILLDGAAELGLKPSMSCKAEIAVGRVDEALHVPVQSVFRDGSTTYVYRASGSGYAQAPVRLGRASELFVEIVEGVDEGQTILLREPAAGEVVATLDDIDSSGDPMARRGGPPESGKPGAGETAARPAGFRPAANRSGGSRRGG